jgi:hypothetical protein
VAVDGWMRAADIEMNDTMTEESISTSPSEACPVREKSEEH